jgi:hypothetical protein
VLRYPSISVGFSTAESKDRDVVYRLNEWFSSAIHIMDDFACTMGDGLTARQAISIIENMERRM